MIEPSQVQDLVARWWWNYDEGNFDVLASLLTDDAHFTCRTDTGTTDFEEFVRADVFFVNLGDDVEAATIEQHQLMLQPELGRTIVAGSGGSIDLLILKALSLEPMHGWGLGERIQQLSKGRLDVPEFGEKGRDEVSQLGQAFNRMRRSLEKAIALIDKG